MSKNTNPYDVEMADLAKEIGGNLSIEYHTIKLSITCEQLQTIKENGFPTDVMSCIMAGLLMNGKTEEEVKAFMQEADEAHAHLSISFDAPDEKGLNIKSKEENPLMDILVQAVEKGNAEEDEEEDYED